MGISTLEGTAGDWPANSVSIGASSLSAAVGRSGGGETGVMALAWVLGALHEERVRQFIRRLGSRQLADLNLAPLFGRTLDWLIQDGRHQDVLTQSLRIALVWLHDNREMIRGNVQRESPWWVPGFVDDRIVVQMLDRIETLLLEMSLDPDHAIREKFKQWTVSWAAELQHDPEYRRWGERLKQNLLENDDLQDYLYQLWTDLVAGVEADLESPDSQLRTQLGDLLTGVSEELENDADMQMWVNSWLVESSVSVVDENRQAIASLISDTVRSWDAGETSERIEQAIGRDLQFIRINGTLVGGLVGLVIHAIKLM